MPERVLLTGAGGFVGHHVLEHILTTTDWEIVALDSFRHRGKTDRIREVLDGQPPSPTQRTAPHPSQLWADRVKVLTHDLRVPITAQLTEAIGRVDYVLSVASESHVDRSISEPRSFMENNVAIICTLLDWCRWADDIGPPGPPPKILHVSTDEVYGPAPLGHDHAEGEPHRPSNPYSASKSCQEAIIYSYWRTYGLNVAISNTMNIIGERQDPEKFVPLVLSKVMKGEAVPIHASAEGAPGSRFYLHARNQADALLFLLRTQPFPQYGDASGPVDGDYSDIRPKTMGRWNVVGEREIDNLQMAQLIADAAGRPLNYELVDFHTSRPGHDLRYALDGAKLRSFGWVPPIALEDSLRKTIEWTMRNERWLLP